MPWYRAGTVTVTNGSAVVTGAGTDFVSNTQNGEVFLGPDGRVYEIVNVVSATDLRITPAYMSATAGGQAYGIQPTSSFARDLTIAINALIASFAAVRDGVGQGLFPDGSPASPGMRFSADQDTGIARVGDNVLGLIAGGRVRLTVGGDGIVNVSSNAESQVTTYLTSGVTDQNFRLATANGVAGAAGEQARLGLLYNNASQWGSYLSFIRGAGATDAYMVIGTSGTERARIDAAGRLWVGVSSGSAHHIGRLVGQGAEVLSISNAGFGFTTARFYSVGATNLGSAVECALAVGTNPSTGRSFNAGGTINASGADYAEYMTKTSGCGAIAKGDVCGVDRDGRLTRTWADALRYVVKSTDPSLVGGDTWAAHLPPRPEIPGDEPTAPIAPGPMPGGHDEAAEQARAAWRHDIASYPALRAAYDASHVAWTASVDAYKIALPAWQAEMEKARACVDRVAFSGQVPVNVDADTLATCKTALADGVAVYLVAIARGAGIGVTGVREGDMTLAQYMRRVGCVWAIRDDRPWVDVQHG